MDEIEWFRPCEIGWFRGYEIKRFPLGEILQTPARSRSSSAGIAINRVKVWTAFSKFLRVLSVRVSLFFVIQDDAFDRDMYLALS